MPKGSFRSRMSPALIVEAAASEALPSFAGRYSDLGFIAVSLEEDAGEMVAGLAGTVGAGDGGSPVQPALSVMSFATAIHDPTRDSVVSAGQDAPPDFDDARAVEFFETHSCFLVPLRKRADVDAAFMDRISVGRARNVDIVLRHASVSKFHGWLSADEVGTMYVTDAGSKNGTMVDGDFLVPKTPRPLVAGSRIQFGRVLGVYYPTELLWRLLRG